MYSLFLKKIYITLLTNNLTNFRLNDLKFACVETT